MKCHLDRPGQEGQSLRKCREQRTRQEGWGPVEGRAGQKQGLPCLHATPPCTVHPGYVGQNCSEELSACQSQPCHNHRTCTFRPGGFHCTWPARFAGLHCEGDLDQCLDQPCHSAGTTACHLLANAFHCQCLPGHTGVVSCGVRGLRGPMAPIGRHQPPVHPRAAAQTPPPASYEA